jgi:hypothetical protein
MWRHCWRRSTRCARKLWQGRGKDLLSPVAYLDVDGTIAPTSGQRKQGMDMSYKGIWGYARLVVSLANTKEVLYVVNRPGNAPSHQDAATAAVLRCSPSMIRKLAASGELPAGRIGCHLRTPADAVEKRLPHTTAPADYLVRAVHAAC